MSVYNESAECPKCGCRYIGTRCAGYAMRRDCGRCGFVWDETPLDQVKGVDGMRTVEDVMRILGQKAMR